MPRRFLFKAAFQKAFGELSPAERTLAEKAIEAIGIFLQKGSASHGLRIKKLHGTHSYDIFEGRISADLRIVWLETKEETIFSLIGSHDEVKKFIKNI